MTPVSPLLVALSFEVAKDCARVDVEDVVQEVLLKASINLEDFEHREDAGLIHWLARMVEHEILRLAEYHGAKKRDAKRDCELDNSTAQLVEEIRAEGDGPSTQVVKLEDQELLLECLDALSSAERELILMRVYANASYDFVREQLGYPSVNAATKAFIRAKTSLAKELARRGGSS